MIIKTNGDYIDLENLRVGLIDRLSKTDKKKLSIQHGYQKSYYAVILTRLETKKVSIRKMLELNKKLGVKKNDKGNNEKGNITRNP